MPECDVTPIRGMVKTQVAGTEAVEISICPVCDTRQCQRCFTHVLDRKSKTCSQGHPL